MPFGFDFQKSKRLLRYGRVVRPFVPIPSSLIAPSKALAFCAEPAAGFEAALTVDVRSVLQKRTSSTALGRQTS